MSAQRLNEPSDHHYAPQFYLRNFAVDPERLKITTVSKNGHMAVWSKRSIKTTGVERDFYVHIHNGAPVCVETAISRRLENPISDSETWRKISSGHSADLDETDRPVLYALIRHLQWRTPHTVQTVQELAAMAADPEIPFTAEERLMYAVLRSNPGALKAHTNRMAASIEWAREEFFGCSIAVLRSPLPLRSTTSPVLSIRAPDHPALSLPLPGQTPYSFVLSLDPHTLALLTLGDFDGAFVNERMDAASALGFNRQYAGQFAYFAAIRHLITDRDGLADDMTWAPYRFVSEDDRKVVFRRKV